jgi:hydroxymethylbilane synthase
VSDLDDDGRVVDRVFLRAVVGTGDGALLRASATGNLDDVEKLGAALAAELLDMGGGASDAAGGGPATASVNVQSGVDR